MDTYGATREDFGITLCVAQRYNASHNPNALLGHKPLDMEAYMNARPNCRAVTLV